MGFFSGISRAFKKVFKGVTKVVKKVTKGISKLAKKVVKGVKGLAKKINKLGPLAAIAIGFFVPPLGTGIWGAMAKGALTGFISSGGKLKGALLGAAGGGLGYGMSQGLDAFKGGWNSDTLGANATFTQKLTSAFDAVGTSTSDGVAQMYNSTAKYLKSGDLTNFDSFDYLTDSGTYRDTSLSKTNLFEPTTEAVPVSDSPYTLTAEMKDKLGKQYLENEKVIKDNQMKKFSDEWGVPADSEQAAMLHEQEYGEMLSEAQLPTKSKYDFKSITDAIGTAINTEAPTPTAMASPYAVTSVEGLNVGEGGLGDFSGRGSRSMNIGDFRLGVFGGGDYSLLANKSMRLS